MAVDASVASSSASFALRAAGLALTFNGKIVDGAFSLAHSIESVSIVSSTSSTVFRVSFASSTCNIASFALIDRSLVETFGAVECANASNHDERTFIIAGTVI